MRSNRIAALVAVCAIAALAPATPVTAAPSAPSAPSTATTIVLERSGGFAGTQDSYVVDRRTTDGRRALRLTETREFRWLRGSYQPRNPCCDRFSYRLTVTYRGGLHKTVTTVQGATAPRILWNVITEVERIGDRPRVSAPAGPPDYRRPGAN